MKRNQVTDWFPASVKPVRNGVYEFGTAGGVRGHYAKWNGDFWCLSSKCVDSADLQGRRSFGFDFGYYTKWRGLTAKAR